MPTPRTRPFAQVDVFAQADYLGNPVAVVLDGDDLPTADMARFARWTNLSETTFVLPPTNPDADYRLRIFTPGTEVPFAGHPTLGSAHAWLSNGGSPRTPGLVVQESAAGLVELKLHDRGLAFAAPPTLRTGPLEPDDLAAALTALGVSPDQVVGHQWIDNGTGWAAIRLATAAEVLALEPDFTNLPGAVLGVIGTQPAGSETQFEVRGFAPGHGIPEDPVTGSLNAGLAEWLIRTHQAPTTYSASQGRKVGRAGTIHVSTDPTGTIWIGGRTTTHITGTVTL